MTRRLAVAVLLVCTLSSAAFGQGGARYRVTIEAGEDDDIVISQLVATYRARLEPFREEGFHGFVATMSESSARLLSSHPRVLRVEEIPSSSPAPAVKPTEQFREPVTTAAVALTPKVNAGSAQWTTGLYQYDGSGNIKRIDTDAFIYDRFGRVKMGTAGAGKWQDYTYDRFGNLLTIATDGAAPVTLGVDPNTNQVTQAANVTASYDEVGQLLSVSSGDSFQWDGLGMVTKSTVAGVPRVHLYTVNDERIATINRLTNVEEWTLRDAAGKVLRSFTREPAQWTWTEDYVYREGQLLAAEVGGAHRRLQFHLDHLGTPRLITSDGGARVALHTYYPFGREATDPAQDGERRKFTGHERDAPSLDYMHARYYNPAWGRFLSVDPTWGSAHPRRPQSWNRYSYVNNNPVSTTDPDGRCPPCVGVMNEVQIYIAAHPEQVERITSALFGMFVLADQAESDDGSYTLTTDTAATDTSMTVGEGIYEFPDAQQGGTYVGQSGDVPQRLNQHENSGKKDPNDPAKATEVKGGKSAREHAEQNRINELGGKAGTPGSQTSNKVNPIGPRRAPTIEELYGPIKPPKPQVIPPEPK